MEGFNKLIFFNGTHLDFRFTKIISPGGEKFFVNVVSRQETIASFEMKSDGIEYWVITHPVPEWILPIQRELSNHITSMVKALN